MNYIDFIKNKPLGREQLSEDVNDPNIVRMKNIKTRIKYAQSGARVTLDYDVEGSFIPTAVEYQKEEKRSTTVPETVTQQYGVSSSSDGIGDWAEEKAKYYFGNTQGQSVVLNPETGVYSVSANHDLRGIRNNNWLNIRISNEPWQGKVSNNTDGEFEQFETPEFGIRAAVKNIRSYYNRGLDTIKKIISTWAPPSDNNPTSSYIKNVSNRMGVKPDDVINIYDDDTMVQLIAAMIVSELGQEGDMEIIKKGVKLAKT